MNIANIEVVAGLAVRKWRTWPVLSTGRLFLHYRRKQVFVVVSRWKVALEPAFGVLIVVIVIKVTLLLHLIVLVVAGPNDNGRMVSKATDIIFGLSLYRIRQCRPDGIHPASKHEVLPDKDTQFVTYVVKGIVLINTSTPDPRRD